MKQPTSTKQRVSRQSGLTTSGQLPAALKNFSELPDSAMVRQPIVEGLCGCSSATVWRWVKSGKLPAPKRLSDRISAWNVGQLRRFLAA